MIARPQTDEYYEYYGGYVRHVPEGADVLALLQTQAAALKSLLSTVTDEQANVRPAPGEWSIKEVLGHICDTERILSYRALRIARGDITPLAGFEQDDYVNGTDFSVRPLADLLEEFEAARRANYLCFRAFTPAEIDRRGTASNYPFSVRALLYILVGHVNHHINSLQTDYHIGE